MELLQLRYFCHAANTENFSHTAKEFRVPQSNISQSIKRLEDELDATLFTRTSNRVELNHYGKLFYQNVSLAMQLIDEAAGSVSRTKAKSEIKVAIPMHRQALARSIMEFQKQHPDVTVTTSSLPIGAPTDGFDIIVMDGSLKSDDFTRKKVLRDKMVLVAAIGVLPEGDFSPAEVMRNFTYVTHKKGTFMHKYVQVTCRALGFEPTILTPPPEESAKFFVPRCVEEKTAVALVPSRTKWIRFFHDAFDIREIGEFYRETYIYRRKSTQNHPYMDEVYDCLLKVFDS